MGDRDLTFNAIVGAGRLSRVTDRIRQDVDLVTARINYRLAAARSSRSTDLPDLISI